MVSLLIKEKLYIGEVVLGTGFGVVIGPYCLDIFNPRSWATDANPITLEFMRIVLAIGLFAIGVELPRAYLAEHKRSLIIMVVPTMVFGWFVSAGLLRALFPNLNFTTCLGIAACLTPTDPILANAIVTGNFAIKNVPGHIRRIISAESAVNDGMAYPFLAIAIYLTTEPSDRVAFGKWFLVGWLYQVILGTVIGTVLGVVCSILMRYTYRKGLIDRESYVTQFLALAFFTIGLVSTLGSDDLLAAFAAGSAVSWSGHFNTHTSHEVFSSVIDLVLNCACFIYIGAWLPFSSFNSPELGIVPWKLLVLFLGILLLRRIPCFLLIYKWVPDIRDWREALFCGHFGPMGVGAIFISTLAISRLPHPNNPPETQMDLLASTLHPIVSFVVLGSILIHGLSIPAFWFTSRTVSMTHALSRTWTFRNSGQPEWVLWIRRSGITDVTEGGGGNECSDQTGDIEEGVMQGEFGVGSGSGNSAITPSPMTHDETTTVKTMPEKGSDGVTEVQVSAVNDNADGTVDWDNSCYDGVQLKMVASASTEPFSPSFISSNATKLLVEETQAADVSDGRARGAYKAGLDLDDERREKAERVAAGVLLPQQVEDIEEENNGNPKLVKRVQFSEEQ